jgi:hypothetical protein
MRAILGGVAVYPFSVDIETRRRVESERCVVFSLFP